jgi:hypothetical protein
MVIDSMAPLPIPSAPRIARATLGHRLLIIAPNPSAGWRRHTSIEFAASP